MSCTHPALNFAYLRYEPLSDASFADSPVEIVFTSYLLFGLVTLSFNAPAYVPGYSVSTRDLTSMSV